MGHTIVEKIIMKNKILRLLILLPGLLFGCKNDKVFDSEVINSNEKEINIVTTIFPIYDITKALTKNVKNINTNMLLDSGIDLHNYSPTSNDLIKLNEERKEILQNENELKEFDVDSNKKNFIHHIFASNYNEDDAITIFDYFMNFEQLKSNLGDEYEIISKNHVYLNSENCAIS